MSDQQEDVKPISQIGPSTSPKYHEISRDAYGYLDTLKKYLDAIAAALSTGSGISIWITGRVNEGVTWIMFAMGIGWSIRYLIGIHLDKCKVKNPFP